MSKNLHLLLSGVIVILAGLVYGGYPSYLMPLIFDFEANALDLKNILRAVMGLYIGISVFWLIGATKQDFWKAATLCNILFMGGIAFGRMVSTVFDGISTLFTPALILELLFFAWGLYNLKKYD